MPSILVIEKLGNIKSTVLKTPVEDELYKKAGLKSPEGFRCFTTWNVEIQRKKYNISVYGKTSGRANQENKYDFPPPIDNTLFFGSCVLVNKNGQGDMVDLTENEWDVIYESLFGGFEDLGEDDSEDESDEEDDVNVKKTKDGYVKDGFVVDEDDDDEDDDDDDDEDEDDEEEDEEVYVKPAKKSKSSSSKIKSVFELKTIESQNEDAYLDCTSELSEESYIE